MAGKMSAPDREKMYTEYLRLEGYKPDLELNDYVQFEKGGMGYVLPVSEDADYFVIWSPTGVRVDGALTRDKVERACNRAMADSKVAKAFLDDEGDVMLAAELFCDPPEAFKEVFARCLTAIESARGLLFEELKSAPG